MAQAIKKIKMLSDLTYEEIGKRLGISRIQVWNYLSLLGLTLELQEMVSEGKLTIKSGAKLKQTYLRLFLVIRN